MQVGRVERPQSAAEETEDAEREGLGVDRLLLAAGHPLLAAEEAEEELALHRLLLGAAGHRRRGRLSAEA